MKKLSIKIIAVSLAFLLTGSIFGSELMAAEPNATPDKFIDTEFDEDFKLAYDRVNKLDGVANFYHSSTDISKMCVNLFDTDINLLDAPIEQVDLHHVTRIFMDNYKYDFSSIEEFDEYLTDNNMNILDFWDTEAFWQTNADDGKHFFKDDNLYVETSKNMFEPASNSLPAGATGINLVSDNVGYNDGTDFFKETGEMVIMIKNVATYNFGKPLHLRIDYKGEMNKSNIALLDNMTWSNRGGKSSLKIQFLNDEGQPIRIMLHQLISDLDNNEKHQLVPVSYNPADFDAQNPALPLLFIKNGDANIQQDPDDPSIFTGTDGGVDEEIDPATNRPLAYPKGCAVVTAVDNAFIYTVEPNTSFMWYRTNLISPRALANYYVDINNDPGVYGQNDTNPAWLKNPYRIYVDENPAQYIEKDGFKYEFVKTRLLKTKDGDDPRFLGNIVHYYKKLKVTKFLSEEGNVELKTPVIADDFVAQEPVLTYDEKEYVYVSSDEVSATEKIHYYKLKDSPQNPPDNPPDNPPQNPPAKPGVPFIPENVSGGNGFPVENEKCRQTGESTPNKSNKPNIPNTGETERLPYLPAAMTIIALSTIGLLSKKRYN